MKFALFLLFTIAAFANYAAPVETAVVKDAAVSKAKSPVKEAVVAIKDAAVSKAKSPAKADEEAPRPVRKLTACQAEHARKCFEHCKAHCNNGVGNGADCRPGRARYSNDDHGGLPGKPGARGGGAAGTEYATANKGDQTIVNPDLVFQGTIPDTIRRTKCQDTCEDEPVCVEEKKATSPKKEAEAQPVKQVEIKPAYKPAEPIKAVEPKPVEPKPVEPKPVEPKPVEPIKVADAKPTYAKPAVEPPKATVPVAPTPIAPPAPAVVDVPCDHAVADAEMPRVIYLAAEEEDCTTELKTEVAELQLLVDKLSLLLTAKGVKIGSGEKCTIAGVPPTNQATTTTSNGNGAGATTSRGTGTTTGNGPTTSAGAGAGGSTTSGNNAKTSHIKGNSKTTKGNSKTTGNGKGSSKNGKGSSKTSKTSAGTNADGSTTTTRSPNENGEGGGRDRLLTENSSSAAVNSMAVIAGVVGAAVAAGVAAVAIGAAVGSSAAAAAGPASAAPMASASVNPLYSAPMNTGFNAMHA
jgi:hypothetical protein